MNIEDVVREMRALAGDIGRADIAGFGNRVNYLAGALERHLKDARQFDPDWDKLEACREALREHMAMLLEARQFDPPQKVIDEWPKNRPWCVLSTLSEEWKYGRTVVGISSFMDPRTLHHRSKFYPEGK